jgi:glutathione-regulated potassium-efflux system ancillary protein KefC
MTSVWARAALWLGLALIASLLSIWLRISTALSEIVVGTIAQLIIGAVVGAAVLGTDESHLLPKAGQEDMLPEHAKTAPPRPASTVAE